MAHEKLVKTLDSWNVFLTSGNMTAEIKETYMYLEGYVYQRSRVAEKHAYYVGMSNVSIIIDNKFLTDYR